jgi:hypothetical protein
MKKLTICLLAVCILPACKKSGLTSPKPGGAYSRPLSEDYVQASATAFDSLFTRSTGGGWTGSDIDYSIPLPNGEVFWPMGDTFIDPVDPADSTHPTRYHTNPGLLSSSIFVSTGQGTTAPTYTNTLYNISGGYPVPYYPAVNDSVRRWSKDGVYYNNKIYAAIFVNQATGSGGAFGVKLVRTDWAVINYPALTVASIQTGSTSTSVIYGSSVMIDSSYIYIYGAENVVTDTSALNYMHVARVPLSSPTSAWTYYNGSSWVSSASSSVRLQGSSGSLTNISSEYSVFKSGSTYYLVSQDPYYLGPNIYRYKSTSPLGPWTSKLQIASASLPTGTGYMGAPWTSPSGEWTYDAKAHPEFQRSSTSTDLLISYDDNNTTFNDVVANADLYRPYFLWVSNWQ